MQIRFKQRLNNDSTPAGGLIIVADEDEFLIVGNGYSVEFESLNNVGLHTDFLSIDEGWFCQGTWVPGRRLNGDELRVSLGSEPQVLKVTLYNY